jgi:hypothetical protein
MKRKKIIQTEHSSAAWKKEGNCLQYEKEYSRVENILVPCANLIRVIIYPKDLSYVLYIMERITNVKHERIWKQLNVH